MKTRKGSGETRPMQDWERVVGQVERGEVRAGPDAAREIARRVEAQGGFWDFEERRAEAEMVLSAIEDGATVITLTKVTYVKVAA